VSGNVSIHLVAFDYMRRLRSNQDPLIRYLFKGFATPFTKLFNLNWVHYLDDILELGAIDCQTNILSESYDVALNAHHSNDLTEVTTTKNLLQTCESTSTVEHRIRPKSKFTCKEQFSLLEQEYLH